MIGLSCGALELSASRATGQERGTHLGTQQDQRVSSREVGGKERRAGGFALRRRSLAKLSRWEDLAERMMKAVPLDRLDEKRAVKLAESIVDGRSHPRERDGRRGEASLAQAAKERLCGELRRGVSF